MASWRLIVLRKANEMQPPVKTLQGDLFPCKPMEAVVRPQASRLRPLLESRPPLSIQSSRYYIAFHNRLEHPC